TTPGGPGPPACHGDRAAYSQGAGRGMGAHGHRPDGGERAAATQAEREPCQLPGADRVGAPAGREAPPAARRSPLVARRSRRAHTGAPHRMAAVAGDLVEGDEPATSRSPTVRPPEKCVTRHRGSSPEIELPIAISRPRRAANGNSRDFDGWLLDARRR